jgi:hypothetical protein
MVLGVIYDVGAKIDGFIGGIIKDWDWLDDFTKGYFQNLRTFFTKMLPEWFNENVLPLLTPSFYL